MGFTHHSGRIYSLAFNQLHQVVVGYRLGCGFPVSFDFRRCLANLPLSALPQNLHKQSQKSAELTGNLHPSQLILSKVFCDLMGYHFSESNARESSAKGIWAQLLVLVHMYAEIIPNHCEYMYPLSHQDSKPNNKAHVHTLTLLGGCFFKSVRISFRAPLK